MKAHHLKRCKPKQNKAKKNSSNIHYKFRSINDLSHKEYCSATWKRSICTAADRGVYEIVYGTEP